MNNEPVAWIWSEDGCNMGVCLDQDKQIGKQEFQDYSIPLYTHPVKEHFEDEPQAEELHEIMQSNAELTDEEIEKVIRKHWNKQYGSRNMLTLCKAVLKEAQEK